mgnify:CR=1 FL=1
MKIAIHNRPGSFSARWIEYCKMQGVDYKLVNTYDNDIVRQVEGCDAFMWHYHHTDYRDSLFAKQLLFSLQMLGIKVFPNFNTSWHFDDKVGQKYMLEAIGAPMVPSYVFYTKDEAMRWIEHTDFPKVFKLRGGAGSHNVMLAHNRSEAIKFVNKAFGKGFSQKNLHHLLSDNIRKYKAGKVSVFYILKDIAAFYLEAESYRKMHSREKGYAYFQEFIPNNTFDIRVCVIGNKAFAIKRMVRENDFRASGSGNIIYAKAEIDERCVKIAFEVSSRLGLQCVGIDFVFDKGNNPLIVEMSYGFTTAGYVQCEGYWTSNMEWYEGKGFDFCGWMVENLINTAAQ